MASGCSYSPRLVGIIDSAAAGKRCSTCCYHMLSSAAAPLACCLLLPLPMLLLQLSSTSGEVAMARCCTPLVYLQPTRPFPEHSPAAQSKAPWKSTWSMSTFWSDTCSGALDRPLPVLLDTVYAVGGVLVSLTSVCRVAHALAASWPGVAPPGPPPRCSCCRIT